MATELKKINDNTPLNPGDKLVIELKKKYSINNTIDAYMLATQIATASNDVRYTVDRWDYAYNADNTLAGVRLEITINNNQQIVQAGVITPAVIITALVVIGAAMFSVTTYKVIDVIGDNIDSTAVKTTTYSFGGFALAAIAFVAYLWMKK